MALLLLGVAARPAVAAPPDAASGGHVAYRAGSAAGTFGPATAVADFDADGKADVAVADRLISDSDVDYVVEVRLSGGTAQVFRFGSPQRALAVTAIDIDHDHDLDLVFTPVIGRRIVGVWLNDGSGHFTRDHSGALPRDLPQLQGVSTPRPTAPVPLVVPGSRRLHARPSARSSPADEDASEASEPVQDDQGRPAAAVSPDSPRGPPTFLK